MGERMNGIHEVVGSIPIGSIVLTMLKNNTITPVYPHDPIEEIARNIFMVRGSIKMNALIRITRNMAIIRHCGELTLVNPIRLCEDEEENLQDLGNIKHVVRLGSRHGVDDPYYVNKFKAKFWCQHGGTIYPQPAIDVQMQSDRLLPFPNAELFCFKGIMHPESALLLNVGDGLLLTCDSIQHYGDYKHNNFLARLALPFLGFKKTTLIGPIWLKSMTPAETVSLKREFERLLRLDFDALLGAHGSFLVRGAKTAVRKAVECVFPNV